MDPQGTFGTLLDRFKARGEPARLASGPSLHFQIQGRPAVLEVFGFVAESEGGTRLVVDLRDLSPGALKIYPEGFAFPLLRLFGAQDVRIGDPEFDALYIIKSRPEALARMMFGGACREALIESVRGVGRFMGSVVDLSRERLRVQVGEILCSEEPLERMLRAGREFTAAVLGAEKAATIVWEEPSSAGRCPVCASAFQGLTARCAKCATPHHRECWDYAGGCSTYACGGTRPA